jgi:hypothetical protein
MGNKPKCPVCGRKGNLQPGKPTRSIGKTFVYGEQVYNCKNGHEWEKPRTYKDNRDKDDEALECEMCGWPCRQYPCDQCGNPGDEVKSD